MTVIDTKTKILESAFSLFSRHGYEGTSMREISRHAEVNLSAINYHFQSKENLCQEVLNKAAQELSDGIGEVIREHGSLSFAELVPVIFRDMLSHSGQFTSCFKILQGVDIEPHFICKEDQQIAGPPGSFLLLQRLTSEVGPFTSLEDRVWVVQTIFCQMTHLVLISGTAVAQSETYKENFTCGVIEGRLARLAGALIREISGPADSGKSDSRR